MGSSEPLGTYLGQIDVDNGGEDSNLSKIEV